MCLFEIWTAHDVRLLLLSRELELTPTEKQGTLHRFEGEGGCVVSKVRYEDGKVWINATQYFTNVPEDVREYEVGAYQVCEKWLKDKRGKTLSHAEICLYPMILVSITETLRGTEAIGWVLW